MSFFKKSFFGISKIIIIILIIAFVPGLPPDLDFESFSLNSPKFVGPLSINDKLNNAERLFENNIKGPEDFAIFNNEIYTSCHGGIIAKITGDKLIPVLKTGRQCDGLYEEHKCGRPLGIKFDKNGLLYIADAYYGLLRANLSTGNIETLVSMNEKIDGNVPFLPNSIAIDDDTIYWTDSSTTHQLYDGTYTLFGNGRGRVLKHTISKKKNEVLSKNIHFANGIILSADRQYLIFAETFRARLLRYHLYGPKSGITEIFIDNLPGFPDNLNNLNSKHFVVSLIMPLDNLSIFLSNNIILRKFLARSLYLIESTFKIVNYFLPSTMFDKIIHWLGHFEMKQIINSSMNTNVMSVIIDYNGKLITSLHSTDNKISSISSLVKFNNYYYLGSPFNPYVARVKIIN